MAVISGFLAGDADSGYDRLYLTGDLDDYSPAWIDDLVYWAAIPSPGAQLLTENYPVSTTPLVRSGHVARSYLDDYYYRIHVVPRVLDIGNLLTVRTHEVLLWNAWLTPQALSAIGESGTDGLAESGLSAPTTFMPLEERLFYVESSLDGPATINALYTFEFPSESPTLDVRGRRVSVLGHSPNWGEPVRERLEWLTDVLPALAGNEQRVGLRGVPRRWLEYSVLTRDRAETIRLETLVMGWQSRLFAVPMWQDAQTLAADLSAGSQTIPCAVSGYGFEPNGLVLLWLAHDRYEALAIDSVELLSLALKVTTLAAWPAGTRLLPVRLGRLPARQKFVRETNRHLSATLDFSLIEHPSGIAEDIGEVYAGYHVYPGSPNWADPIENEMARQIETLDYDTGAPWIEDISGLTTQIKSWHWLLKSRAEIVALRAWLDARKGRLVPFWSPTQSDDIEVVSNIGDASTVISIVNIGYARYLAGRADRRHLLFETMAGARYFRAIVGESEVNDEVETLTIDSPLGELLTPADILRVRFLHLVRLEMDDVEIVYHTTQVAECSTLLRSLPA